MTTKQNMKDLINDAISNNEIFGNSIVNIADAWRDAITDKLNKMNKEELTKLYEEAKQINSKFEEVSQWLQL